jgi:methionyl-tRNA synthetase
LFAKIEDEEIQKQIDKLEATKTANTAENKKNWNQKEAIQFEDFAKMDIHYRNNLGSRKNAENKQTFNFESRHRN